MNKIDSISSITNGPRQSNFELLRIIAMIMILGVHANFISLGIPNNNDLQTYPIPTVTRFVLEQFCTMSVCIFVLISGWFGIRVSLKGFCNFIFQCIFFLAGIYLLLLFFGDVQLSINGIKGCFALNEQNNWFIRAYIGLYIVSPVLNSFIENASRNKVKIFLISFFAFQTIYGFIVNTSIFNGGYSTFSFIGLYILASYCKKYKPLRINNLGGGTILCIPAACILICVIFDVILVMCNKNEYCFWLATYSNPFVIIGALFMLLWFSKCNIKNNTIINFIAKSSFAGYLFHANPNIFLSYYKPMIENAYASYSGIIALLIISVIVLAWYSAGIIIDQPRRLIWNFISVHVFQRK